MQWQLVIFDCDGVLVDSERITNQIFAEAISELGWKIGFEETVQYFMGRSLQDCLAILEGKLGRAVPEAFIARYKARALAALAREVQPIPGIVQALEAITLPVCVASSGDHVKMRTTLGATGLLERFEPHLFSVTEVEHGKPHPAVFLHAAHRLGCEPARCAVVEDTPTGVQAGVAAGMHVFGYADLAPPILLEQAGARVFSDMRDLPRLLDDFVADPRTSPGT